MTLQTRIRSPVRLEAAFLQRESVKNICELNTEEKAEPELGGDLQ